MKVDPIAELFSSKHVAIVHPYLPSEISVPKFGGARLIAEQIRYLEQSGYNVEVISLAEIGSLTSLAYRIQSNLRIKGAGDNEGKVISSEETRWGANLIQVLVNELLSRVDILYQQKIEKCFRSLHGKSTLLFNYPYSFRPFILNSKRIGMKCILYEHNIEWQFFEEKLSKNPIFSFLTRLARKVELDSVRKADYIFVANGKDKAVLTSETGIPESKTILWIPVSSNRVAASVPAVDASIMRRLAGKTVIGFVGTDFAANITAVENILAIATHCPDSVTFLVMGSVKRPFEKRAGVPANVMFTGYVEGLDSYLSICDAFINPKTSSDTGVETKMFDFVRFRKPIFSTKIGAQGFDNFDNVVIATVDQMPSLLKELIGKKSADALQ